MKKIILFIIILFLLLNLVSAALTTEIDIKKAFSLGDIISFTYIISSDIPIQIIYMDYIECPNAPVSFLEQKQINLKAEEPYTSAYSGTKIDKSIKPQTCTAYVQILRPIPQTISKEFSIATIDQSFSFKLKICKDQACTQESKTFIQSENIYLDYFSDKTPTITATLIYPDQSTKQTTLPTQIKAEQIGTYNLEVTASKEDYRTITTKEQFGVIESEAQIQQEIIIPQKEEKIEKQKSKLNYLWIIIPIIIIILIIIFLIYKRREPETPSPGLPTTPSSSSKPRL